MATPSSNLFSGEVSSDAEQGMLRPVPMRGSAGMSSATPTPEMLNRKILQVRDATLLGIALSQMNDVARIVDPGVRVIRAAAQIQGQDLARLALLGLLGYRLLKD